MKNDDNERAGMRAVPRDAGDVRDEGRGHLRLVVSRRSGLASQRAPIALLPGTWNARIASPRGPIAAKPGFSFGTEDKRRLDVRHKEGIIMKAFAGFIGTAGRFAVGFGSGLALVCAFVIVTTDLGESPKVVRPADIVHLDPVVVTISTDRFDEIQAELGVRPVLVRTPDHGEGQG